MKWKKFTSPNKAYEVSYPEDWICESDTDDAKGGTFMFYNRTSQKGILRTTLITIKPDADSSTILDDIKNRNRDAALSKKGESSYLQYAREVKQGDEQLIIFFCYIAKYNLLLTLSFTLSKEDMKSPQAKKELKIVENIVDKIAFL